MFLLQDKTMVNQHLQLTAGIWTNDTDFSPSTKKNRVQIVANR